MYIIPALKMKSAAIEVKPWIVYFHNKIHFLLKLFCEMYSDRTYQLIHHNFYQKISSFRRTRCICCISFFPGRFHRLQVWDGWCGSPTAGMPEYQNLNRGRHERHEQPCMITHRNPYECITFLNKCNLASSNPLKNYQFYANIIVCEAKQWEGRKTKFLFWLDTKFTWQGRDPQS